MKKLFLLLLAIPLIFAACKVEEDKEFDQTDLYGTWTQISPDPADDDYVAINHSFTETQYTVTNISSTSQYYITYNYTWGNNTFKYNILGINVSNEVTTLNANTLTFKTTVLGITETYTCTKVN